MIATPATLAIGTTAPIFDGTTTTGANRVARLIEGQEEEFTFLDTSNDEYEIFAPSATIQNLSECWLKIKVTTKNNHNIGDNNCPCNCIYIPPAGLININLGKNTIIETITVAAVEPPTETQEVVDCEYDFATLNPNDDVYALITLHGTCPTPK